MSSAENATSTVDYRCFFVKNIHATLTAQSVAVYLLLGDRGGASIAIGAPTPPQRPRRDSGSAQAATIANETTAPAGVTFSAPTTDGAGIAVGDLAPGQVRAVWVRRTAANTSALTGDGVTFGVGFDTAA